MRSGFIKRMSTFSSDKLPFSRFVRELLFEEKSNIRIQALALHVLQWASETYIVALLEDTNLCALHAK